MLNSNMLHSNNRSIKFLLRSLFLLFFSFAITSCGGSDGDGDSDGGSSSSSSSSSSSGGSSSSSSSGGVSNVVPITPLTSKQQASTDFFGAQLDVTGEGGSDGDIEVVFGGASAPAASKIKFAMNPEEDFGSVIPRVQLKNGVPSMSVTDVQRTVAADFSCQKGDAVKGSQDSNYVSGVVNTQGTVNGSSVSCASTFQTVLPTTVPGMFSVMELLEDWGSDDDTSKPIEETRLVSTNCPQGDDGFMDTDPISDACSGSFLSNFVVTDGNGKVHRASTKITFQFTGTVDFPDIPGAFDPGQFDPGQFDPGQFDPGQFDPGQFDPGQFDPGQFDPGQFDPGSFVPEGFDPSTFDPNNFDPSIFIPGGFEPPG